MSAALHPVADAHHLESMVGPVSSHYEIGPVLGTGAFSKVFRGRPLHKHVGSGSNEPETVALKIVDFNGARFCARAELTARHIDDAQRSRRARRASGKRSC